MLSCPSFLLPLTLNYVGEEGILHPDVVLHHDTESRRNALPVAMGAEAIGTESWLQSLVTERQTNMGHKPRRGSGRSAGGLW